MLTAIAEAIDSRGAGLGHDVEVLATEHLGANVGPYPADSVAGTVRQIDAGDDVIGPCQRQITDQNCRRHPELFRRSTPLTVAMQGSEPDVCRRPAPASRRAVDHVVVHQRRGVQQLQCREQQQRLFVGILARHRSPAPIGESRAQPLAAAENEVLQPGDQGVVVAADVRRIRTAVVQIPAQLVGDGAGQLDGCRCFHAQRDTSSRSLAIMARQVYSARRCPAGFASLTTAGEARSSFGGRLLRQPHYAVVVRGATWVRGV